MTPVVGCLTIHNSDKHTILSRRLFRPSFPEGTHIFLLKNCSARAAALCEASEIQDWGIFNPRTDVDTTLHFQPPRSTLYTRPAGAGLGVVKAFYLTTRH